MNSDEKPNSLSGKRNGNDEIGEMIRGRWDKGNSKGKLTEMRDRKWQERGERKIGERWGDFGRQKGGKGNGSNKHEHNDQNEWKWIFNEWIINHWMNECEWMNKWIKRNEREWMNDHNKKMHACEHTNAYAIFYILKKCLLFSNRKKIKKQLCFSCFEY